MTSKDERGESEPLRPHRHQREAIEAAQTGASYVLTTGTGSGKSLAYIVPIVDAVVCIAYLAWFMSRRPASRAGSRIT